MIPRSNVHLALRCIRRWSRAFSAMADFDLHLWLLDERQATPAQLARARTFLSAQELARAERFRFARDCRLFIAARSHLRQVLSRHAPIPPADWKFQLTASGRPEIAPGLLVGALHFSVSHTYGLVAVLVGDVPDIGVDVERLDRTGDLRPMAQSNLTRREKDSLAHLTETEYRERFLQLWTLKEAYAKARGLGLSLGFHRFGFVLQNDQPHAFGEDAETSADLAGSWHFATMRPTAVHLLSLATRLTGSSKTIEWTTL
jgi:4'-phosphopantetheinyl transferase